MCTLPLQPSAGEQEEQHPEGPHWHVAAGPMVTDMPSRAQPNREVGGRLMGVGRGEVSQGVKAGRTGLGGVGLGERDRDGWAGRGRDQGEVGLGGGGRRGVGCIS